MGRIEFRDEIVIQDDQALCVLDGDTIEYRDVHYRLAGFDAPERRGGSPQEKRMAQIAAFRLAWLLKPHNSRVLKVLGKRDKYGRSVAQLLVNGEDVAVVAVRELWGQPYTKGRRASWSSPQVVAAMLARSPGERS